MKYAPLLLIALAACTDLSTGRPIGVPAIPPATEDTCNAAAQSALIGQDATALERVMLLGPVRVIRPGMAVTMDFSPERINFDVTAAGRIGRIYCG
jgi:hypothetical protein